MSRMWSLRDLRYDESIDGDEIDLFIGDGRETETMPKSEAIALAHSRGQHLVAVRPAGSEEPPVVCEIMDLAVPVEWEELPEPESVPEVDERLWFEASWCGGRDFLIDGSGHTFPGRMHAWCSTKQLAYNVSLNELGEMSEQARYFVRGFLSGNEPEPPYDDQGDIAADDLLAWRHETREFRRTGGVAGHWGTCDTCGRVLVPSTDRSRCQSHDGPPPN